MSVAYTDWRRGMAVHLPPPLRAMVVLSVLFAGARLAPAAVSSVEDLTGCKLPNGRASIPIAGTTQATNGVLFKIGTTTLLPLPTGAEGKPLPLDEALTKVRDAQSADLQYLLEGKGSLWAFSGNISVVPNIVFLADASGKKLDPPGPIPKTSRNLAGQSTDVQEGAVYIVKTTDNHYALIRILEKDATAINVQYVYQPDGTLNFDIPVNPIQEYAPLRP